MQEGEASDSYVKTSPDPAIINIVVSDDQLNDLVRFCALSTGSSSPFHCLDAPELNGFEISNTFPVERLYSYSPLKLPSKQVCGKASVTHQYVIVIVTSHYFLCMKITINITT